MDRHGKRARYDVSKKDSEGVREPHFWGGGNTEKGGR